MSAPVTVRVSTETMSTPAGGAQAIASLVSAPAVSAPEVSTPEASTPEASTVSTPAMAEMSAGERSARHQLALLQALYSELFAYSRATVAAVRDGEIAPYAYLTGWLEEHGALPAQGERPAQLLARAYVREVEL